MKKNLIRFLLIPILVNACGNDSDSSDDHGKRPRWPVKILTDDASSGINFRAIPSSIDHLITIHPQVSVKKDTRRFGIEFNTYTIQCHIREWKHSKDGDDHLVLEDLSDPDKTMIGEIPDPLSNEVMISNHVSEFLAARTSFNQYKHPDGTVDTGIYEITGVAFFDHTKGQLGVAPNGIEIHPVLAITKK